MTCDAAASGAGAPCVAGADAPNSSQTAASSGADAPLIPGPAASPGEKSVPVKTAVVAYRRHFKQPL